VADHTKLSLLRVVHALIFVVMVCASLFVAYAGIVDYRGPVLIGAAGLVAIEGAVLIGNRWQCPLTRLARRYGSAKGWALDAVLTENGARMALWLGGCAYALGLALLALRA